MMHWGASFSLDNPFMDIRACKEQDAVFRGEIWGMNTTSG